MEPELIILCIIGLVLIIAVAIPLLNTFAGILSGSGTYSEQLSLTANVSTSAAHPIDNVTSIYTIVGYSTSNSTTSPGSATFTLAIVPTTTSVLSISGGSPGHVIINGHSIGSMSGPGTWTFSVPPADLLMGTNTVVFG
jgi:hypothetical protein